MSRLTPIWLSCLLVPAACLQTATVGHAPPPVSAGVRTARAVQAWSLREGDLERAVVVYYRSPNEPSESFFSVRNRWHQELGVIDSLGIAWRYRPHRDEAERVATGTVAEGAAAIVEASANCSLEETDLDALRQLRRCSGDW